MKGEIEPYNSFGNGSAMRVSPVGGYARSLNEAERIAKLTAEITHDHPEGIKGAQAIAGAIWLAKSGVSKAEIKAYVQAEYGYDPDISLDALRKKEYVWDETCQTTVPIAIKCFLESIDFEDTVKTAVSVGGDSDTIAAIAGSIAEAYFGIGASLIAQAKNYLDDKLLGVAERFTDTFLK